METWVEAAHEVPEGIRLDLRDEILIFEDELGGKLGDVLDGTKQLLIVRVLLGWSLGRLKVAQLSPSASVVIAYFHEDDAVFAYVRQGLDAFRRPNAQDIDVDKPFN